MALETNFAPWSKLVEMLEFVSMLTLLWTIWLAMEMMCGLTTVTEEVDGALIGDLRMQPLIVLTSLRDSCTKTARRQEQDLDCNSPLFHTDRLTSIVREDWIHGMIPSSWITAGSLGSVISILRGTMSESELLLTSQILLVLASPDSVGMQRSILSLTRLQLSWLSLRPIWEEPFLVISLHGWKYS